MASNIPVPAKPHSLVVFFILAFGISWVVWIPNALASHDLIPFQLDPTLSGLMGAFGPFFAALLTTAIFDGKAGFRAILDRLLTWRVGIQWYLFVMLWPAVLSLAVTLIAVLSGSASPDFSQPPFVQLYPLPPELVNTTPLILFLPFVFLQQLLLGSSMGEEPGWRGYALPRMISRFGSLYASLILGVLWSIWHLPIWLSKGHAMQETFWGWSALGLLATTIFFTWVYNNTKGSLLLALLFHTSIAVTGLFLASAESHPLIDIAITWGLVVLVILIFGPNRFLRPSTGIN